MQNSTIFALLCESKTVPKWEVKTKYMGRFATANNTKPKICVNFIKQTKRRTNEIILQIMLSSPIFTSPVRGRQVPIKRKAHGLSWTVHCPSDFWGGVFNLSKPLLPPIPQVGIIYFLTIAFYTNIHYYYLKFFIWTALFLH